MNASGLGQGGASLGMNVRNESGIPSNCMYRVLMDRCETVDDVLSLLDRVPVTHHPAHNVFADDSGALLAIPSQRRLLMARGQPCEAEFFELAL